MTACLRTLATLGAAGAILVGSGLLSEPVDASTDTVVDDGVNVTLSVPDIVLTQENGCQPLPAAWTLTNLPTNLGDGQPMLDTATGETGVVDPLWSTATILDPSGKKMSDAQGNKVWHSAWPAPSGRSASLTDTDCRHMDGLYVQVLGALTGTYTMEDTFEIDTLATPDAENGTPHKVHLTATFRVSLSRVRIVKIGKHRWRLQGVGHRVAFWCPQVRLQKKRHGTWHTIWTYNKNATRINRTGIFKIPAEPKGHYRLHYRGGSAERPATRRLAKP